MGTKQGTENHAARCPGAPAAPAPSQSPGGTGSAERENRKGGGAAIKRAQRSAKSFLMPPPRKAGMTYPRGAPAWPASM
eukprot:scaffold17394_cov114-Isochrysis_galbana.AAC.7